jgi:hypothetical protein
MSLLSKAEMEALVQRKNGWHVSIYMPTHRLSDEIEQDPIRFKNLVSEAEEQIKEVGLREPEAKALLEPLHELAVSREFWRHQSDGLAVFISLDVFRYQRLPLNFDELVVVSTRFHIKPLLPLLSGDGRFYILSLSQNEIRLLQGTRYSVGEVDLEEIPESLQEALKWEDPERRLQWHTSSSNEPGYRNASFHGHLANAEIDSKDFIRRYFKKLDNGLSQILADERAPLVLAGVDYLLPIYKEVNSYQYTLDGGVTGNPDELDLEELHAKARPVVEPHFEESRKEAAALYKQLAGQSDQRASQDVEEVIPAAVYERVDTLFVPRDVHRWGNFDPDTAETVVHSEQEPGDQDLFDLVAAHTFLNNGTVYAVEADQMPGGGKIAAIFRY